MSVRQLGWFEITSNGLKWSLNAPDHQAVSYPSREFCPFWYMAIFFDNTWRHSSDWNPAILLAKVGRTRNTGNMETLFFSLRVNVVEDGTVDQQLYYSICFEIIAKSQLAGAFDYKGHTCHTLIPLYSHGLLLLANPYRSDCPFGCPLGHPISWQSLRV